jgi:phage-related protein
MSRVHEAQRNGLARQVPDAPRLPLTFELRLKAAEGIARVFYCTVVDRRIIVLHQFVKKAVKTPPHELQIARRRMKDVSHD